MTMKYFEVYAPRPIDTPGAEARAAFRHEMAEQCSGFMEHDVRRYSIVDEQIHAVDWESWHVIVDSGERGWVRDLVKTYLNAINQPSAYLVLPDGNVDLVACGV